MYLRYLAGLAQPGLLADPVNFIGWKSLQNGELIVRTREQFRLLLTRDKDFDEEYLKQQVTDSFGIVSAYAAWFARTWPADYNTFIGKVTRLST